MGSPDNDMVKISRESGIKRFTLAFLVSSGSDCQAAWFPNLPMVQEEHHRQPNWPAAKIRRRCHPFIWGRKADSNLLRCATTYPASRPNTKRRSTNTRFTCWTSILNRPPSRPCLCRPSQPGIGQLAGGQPGPSHLLHSRRAAHGVARKWHRLTEEFALPRSGNRQREYHDDGLRNHVRPQRHGQNAIDAANAALKQLQSLGFDASLGLTPMIGMNDVSPQVFTLEDANKMFALCEIKRPHTPHCHVVCRPRPAPARAHRAWRATVVECHKSRLPSLESSRSSSAMLS